MSSEYFNLQTKLEWKCENNHIWSMMPKQIINGSWCRICNHQRHDINKMIELANNKNGYCLSTFYINTSTKLKWKCKFGHVWEAKPSAILENKWCPDCGGTKKYNINDMYKIASIHGGFCLSSSYTNSKNKLIWKCSNEHIWNARPTEIFQGIWCSKCKK